MNNPKICDRCKEVMTELWFHKKDDLEDINICLLCFEKEYGSWDTGEEEITSIDDEEID